ncbi:hypothetical protein Ddc_11555 [Ditylenchus destructor]|nr:hypothetical protein Ddc_11555 [Ditylenchus destructor]
MLSKTTVLVSVLLLLSMANLMLVEARDQTCSMSSDCKKSFSCKSICTCSFSSDCYSGRCSFGICQSQFYC